MWPALFVEKVDNALTWRLHAATTVARKEMHPPKAARATCATH